MNPLTAAIAGADIFKNGLSSIPLQKSAVDLMSGAFRMPGFMRMFIVMGNPMNFADFLYHFVVDLVYRIVRAVHVPGTSPESVFYATMYDFQQQFEEIVESNMHRGCTGLSLAFGYTNPWALIIRHQCDAWASIPTGMLQFLNVFLVDIPAAKCLCKDSQVNQDLVPPEPPHMSKTDTDKTHRAATSSDTPSTSAWPTHQAQ